MDPYLALEALCKARHSTRRFLDKPVSDELVAKILEIARTSPFAGGSKSWEVLVIRDRARIEETARAVRARVATLHASIRPAFQEAFLEYAKNFSSFESAPVLMLPVVRVIPTLTLMLPEPTDGVVRMESENYVKSISCVAMLILLAAESLGLASCFTTGPLLAEEEIATIVAVKPGRRIGALIPIGYSADNQS